MWLFFVQAASEQMKLLDKVSNYVCAGLRVWQNYNSSETLHTCSCCISVHGGKCHIDVFSHLMCSRLKGVNANILSKLGLVKIRKWICEDTISVLSQYTAETVIHMPGLNLKSNSKLLRGSVTKPLFKVCVCVCVCSWLWEQVMKRKRGRRRIQWVAALCVSSTLPYTTHSMERNAWWSSTSWVKIVSVTTTRFLSRKG